MFVVPVSLLLGRRAQPDSTDRRFLVFLYARDDRATSHLQRMMLGMCGTTVNLLGDNDEYYVFLF